MASKKVSELPLTTSLIDNSVFVVNHVGYTNRVTYSTVVRSLSTSVTQSLTSSFFKIPQTATAQQVLTYDGSTNTWVASAVPKELPQTATAQQVLTYDGSTNTWIASAVSTGTVRSVGIDSTDSSIAISNTPITNTGTISLTISSVGLNKLQSGGATNGQILTYNSSTNSWVASAAPKELPQTATAQQVLTYNGSTNTWVASAAPAGGSTGVTVDSTSISSGTTTYLLKQDDANKVMLCNNTAPITVTVPYGIFNVGTEIILIQRGGVVSLSAQIGATIESNENKFKTNGTSAGVCLINIAANTWFLGGNTAT